MFKYIEYLIKKSCLIRNILEKLNKSLNSETLRRTILKQVQMAKMSFITLNDITVLINKSMSIQIFLPTLEFLMIGIFSIFGIYQNLVESVLSANYDHGGYIFKKVYLYLMILSHSSIAIFSFTNFFIQKYVNLTSMHMYRESIKILRFPGGKFC